MQLELFELLLQHGEAFRQQRPLAEQADEFHFLLRECVQISGHGFQGRTCHAKLPVEGLEILAAGALQLHLQLADASGDFHHLVIAGGASHQQLRPFRLQFNHGHQNVLNGAIGNERREGGQLPIRFGGSPAGGASVDEVKQRGEGGPFHFEFVDAALCHADALELRGGLFVGHHQAPLFFKSPQRFFRRCKPLC